MSVLILGSGVIGTSIAYYLARAGHAVTVVDRQPAPAMETSFANAGEISPGYASPWAGPGVPLKAIKWLCMHHSPLVIRPMADLAQWRWGVAMLRNCTQARYAVNKARMVRLAEYSRDCMQRLRQETDIAYDGRALGTLQLFRTLRQLDDSAKDIAVLAAYGVPYELFDNDDYLRHEPGLAAVKDKFVGALRLPGDETGDCFMFTQALAEAAQKLGAQWKLGVHIESLQTRGNTVAGVQTQDGLLQADHYVAALGSYTPRLLQALGLHVPVYPVKGYSITVPVGNEACAPRSTIMDETHKVALTRLGSRIRVGGTAQLSGFDLQLDPERRQTLEYVLNDLFPGALQPQQTTFWAGLRPMTPDGTPIIGATPLRNLHLSTGHGTLGWTMAAGTGRVMADLLSGVTPEISLEGLSLSRYG